MGKYLFKIKLYLLITIVTAFSSILSVSANTVCDSLNNSKDSCNGNSNCNWKWINEENGDGYCTLKQGLKDCNSLSIEEQKKLSYCNTGCTYYITVTGSNIEEGKTTCSFIIESNISNNKLKISWIDNYKNQKGELNENQISFMCADKTVNFWNTNLSGKKFEQVGVDTDGKEVAILDFKQYWNDKYKQTGTCPKISFSTISGNYFAFFPEEEPDEPYNMGGIVDTTNKNPKVDVGKVTNCEVVPEVIKNYIKDALKLIRWIGLVAMIILGILDFVKASASDDQDALKKAWQSVIKRLIAVIILFLLPLLLELVLYIAGLAGFGCGEISEY